MSRVYREKSNYIGLLRMCLQVREDYGNLTYRRDAQGNEYLILSDIIGQVSMFNITGFSEEKILANICYIMCGNTPNNIITDKKERMRIARLK